MNRRKFMKSEFVGGIIGTVCTKSSGEIVVNRTIEIQKYDEKGRLIYWKDWEGDENWMEYDKNDEYTFLSGTHEGNKIVFIDKRERTKLIDYLDNGNRLCLGMYIAECSNFTTFFPVLCHQIIGMGAYQIGLSNVWHRGTNGIKSKMKSASNISKKEIC